MDVEERGKRMMLRRKTNPMTGKHTWCARAQSKRTRAFHKSHFVSKFTGKMAGHCLGKNCDLWLIYPLNMVIFHSYVSLPEGKYQDLLSHTAKTPQTCDLSLKTKEREGVSTVSSPLFNGIQESTEPPALKALTWVIP